MSQTFEELVSHQIDGLYHGALFLHGGDSEKAEHLLVEAMGAAFHGYAEAGLAGFETWLEERLVRAYVRGNTGEGAVPAPPAGVEDAVPASGSRDLHTAAASVPSLARAALWLVLLRRWPHANACEALGIDAATLRTLLMYRHALVAAAMTDDGPSTGKGRNVVT